MTGPDAAQIILFLVLLLVLARPLGLYMARVFEGERTVLSRWLRPVERLVYRLAGVDPGSEQGWKQYTLALLSFSGLGMIAVYALQRLQHLLPLNPQDVGPVTPDSAFNTAVSFVTNTNWQGYGGETTMSYLTQMTGLGVQNFLSAASGMAVLVALIRGFTRKQSATIGNFWVDLTRSVVHILLPLSLVVALALASQGVVQTFSPYTSVETLESEQSNEQIIALGPVASQVAIKQLGTNGGGFFNTNSAHPFENPTPLSNLLEVVAILLIPFALCVTFGRMVRDERQGWALLAAMLVIFIPLLIGTHLAEQSGNPRLDAPGVDSQASEIQTGGNMEGKEVRFGIVNSAIWAVATTAASNGSVNAMHGSFTPLGSLAPLWLMQLGEVIGGGVGSGLYGLLMFAIIAVFMAGLMVGRTPEYLGKKIEAFEVKMAALVLLIPCLVVLLGTAIAVTVPDAVARVGNPGTHGFTEILYAFSSAGNNNGSAMAGLSANNPFYNYSLGIAMWIARYWLMIAVLAIAGSLAAKRAMAVTAGTLPTHTPLFVTLLAGVVVLIGALTFVPALALGPVVEHLQMVAP